MKGCRQTRPVPRVARLISSVHLGIQGEFEPGRGPKAVLPIAAAYMPDVPVQGPHDADAARTSSDRQNQPPGDRTKNVRLM